MFNVSPFNSDEFNADSYTAQPSILVSIEKNITFGAAEGVSNLLNIEKYIINEEPAESILNISKKITEVNEPLSFYERFGWEPIVLLDNIQVGADELCGDILVIKTTGDNHTASFSLILRPDTYNLYSYQGASVQIYDRRGGNVRLLFTGTVNLPSVNVIQERLTLSCIADRRTLLSNLDGNAISYIGYYSPIILTTNNDVYSQITDRLTTVPYDLDFDSYNNYWVTSWTPKTIPDFIFGPNTVYRRDPLALDIQEAADVVNTINITMDYSYQRLHHREFVYTWQHTYAPADPRTGRGGICPFLEDAPSMPTREAIRSAAAGVGWPIRENRINFGKQFLSGNYNCGGSWVQWSTVQSGYFNGVVNDSDGNPVLDDTGNQISRSVPTVVQDNTDLYTMNASWTASKRLNQNMKESYTITVQAPSSIDLYGELATNEDYSFIDPNQHEDWGNYNTWQAPPSGVIIKPDVAGGSSYAIDASDNRSEFSNAFVVALNKAMTTILSSHRDTKINFQCSLKPTMELHHTCKLTGKWINGSGKCTTIKHKLTVSTQDGGKAGESYTDITISSYRSTYSVSGSSLVPVTPPIDNYVPAQPSINLQTHIGVDPSQPGSENWTGYVGNKAIVERVASYNSVFPTINHTKTKYQESFIVNAPAITDLTQDKTLTKGAIYNINIPVDDVEYTSYRGKGRYS